MPSSGAPPPRIAWNCAFRRTGLARERPVKCSRIIAFILVLVRGSVIKLQTLKRHKDTLYQTGSQLLAGIMFGMYFYFGQRKLK